MNFEEELFFKQLLKEAANTGKFTDEARAQILRLFERSVVEPLPDWFIDGLAAVSEERKFLQVCLAAQEEAIRKALAQSYVQPNEVFFEILASLGKPLQTAEAERLLKLTHVPEPKLRGIALLRLAELQNPKVCERLTEELHDSNIYVRKCAIAALAKGFINEAAIELEKLLKTEKEVDVRSAAIMALLDCGKTGIEALERIKNTLTPAEELFVNTRKSLESPTEVTCPGTKGDSN